MPRKKKSPRASGHVTLHEVARLAGVSPITASRALGRPEVVTAATIARVQRAVARTGYVPNLLAGGLASRRSRLVAAVVPQVSNPMFVDAVQSLTDTLSRAGYQVLLGLSGHADAKEEALIGTILSRRPDGIFLIGVTHTRESRRRLLAAKIPVVEAWDLSPQPIDMLVGFSHERIGRAAAEFLLARGHRRFGLVWADEERAMLRRKAFLSVLARRGIDEVPTAWGPAPSTLALGRQGLAELLREGRAPRAVCCSSDTLAHGVLLEAQARGIAVPGELAILGYGDLEFSAHTVPAISTVRIDRAGLGRRAAEALLSAMRGSPLPGKIVDLGYELVERGTTLAPGAG